MTVTAIAVLGGSFTFGTGQTWQLDVTKGDPFTDLFSSRVRTLDMERSHADGSVKGPALRAAREVMFALVCRTGDAAAHLSAIATLQAAWAPLTGGSTTSLVVTIGSTVISKVGAPVELDVDTSMLYLPHPITRATAHFTIYDGS